MTRALTKSWRLIMIVRASGIVFLDGTVVNVGLPTIDRNLHAGLPGLPWIVAQPSKQLASTL